MKGGDPSIKQINNLNLITYYYEEFTNYNRSGGHELHDDPGGMGFPKFRD